MKLIALFAPLVALHAGCLDVHGDRITAADIAAAVPAFASLPPDLVISYAPQPGRVRVFPAGELAQRLRSRGVQGDVPSSVCFAWPMLELATEEMRRAMAAELPEGAELNVVETSTSAVPPGTTVFPLSGLQTRGTPPFLWRGHVAYAPGRQHDVWARVDVKVPYSRVIATEPIRAGERLTAEKVRLEAGSGPPLGSGIVASLEDALGRTSRRLISAGSPVLLAALEEGRTVSRGDAVQVQVRSGSAAIRFDGVAQGSAAIGDTVAVRNPDTGRLIHARVKGAGQAVLELTPGGSE